MTVQTPGMRVVFMGSAEFSRASLDMLLCREDVRVVGVVTQPDRPRGRGRKTLESPIACVAGGRCPVLKFEDVNSAGAVAELRALEPELAVVVAYGQILKPHVLAVPTLGFVNVHASILPAYRGAAPVQWAIANGDAVTGVSTMRVNERMDAGDVILTREVPIAPHDTGGSLEATLSVAGAELLAETLALIAGGCAPRRVQDESRATYAPKLRKDDGRIDWSAPARTICNRVRAFNPRPGSFCGIPPAPGGHVLRVLEAAVEEGGGGAPGTILSWSGAGPLVAAGGGAVRLLVVQPEGGKPMPGSAYVCGHSGHERFE